MPIISEIGRKHPRVRLMIGGMYVLLFLGAVTMVYPFLLMASGSTKSAVDQKRFDLVPDYLVDDQALFKKHLEGLFNESVEAMNMAYDGRARSFSDAAYPSLVSQASVNTWQTFLEEGGLPEPAWTMGYLKAGYSKTTPQGLRSFKQYLQEQHGTVLAANRALETDFPGWNEFFVNPENYITRSMMPVPTPLRKALWSWRAEQPLHVRYVFSIEGFYRRAFLQNQYGRDIEDYNRTHGTFFADYSDVPLATSGAEAGHGVQKEDWETFVRDLVNPVWIRVSSDESDTWQGYLEARYAEVSRLNRQYGTTYASFSEVPLRVTPPVEGAELTDWNALLQGWSDPETGRLYRFDSASLSLRGPEVLWREYLVDMYGSLKGINTAFSRNYASLDKVPMPQEEFHFLTFLDQRTPLRWEFTTRNYRAVMDYMLFHGRGIINTVIYCGLAVLFALLVNPLAAYAMSRYQMPTTYKILLFLLLTMAFPPMVTQIPSFLMLRELNLLNTFAALILPGLAHGYSIFLLKGFFDSLPRDLYESAQIDGASEWTMFWQITMSLSKPILAVIALQAFTLAYSNFMFALLICQDESMWTLMVWLYELQQKSGQGVIYASLMIAAVPTFLIFAVCQNIILRGIVVPVEK